MIRRRHLLRRRSILFSLFLAPVALASGSWALLASFEKDGRAFYENGREVVLTLGRLASALEARDLAAVQGFYDSEFQGRRLGLTRLVPAGEKDGVAVFRFAPEGAADRQDALVEWAAWLAGFDSLEEVGLHVHRLERWDPERRVAVVRFEAIGTQRGRSEPGIDRALFRMAFEPAPGGEGLLIVAADPVEGERLVGEAPQFRNVAAEAAVDFENRYYPPFLEKDLRFAMIRYGPGGMTAVDFDNDGFHDLFVPDGVESRLLRNRGDGSFEDVTEASGLAGQDGVSVAVFADYDNDGWKDAFVSRTFQPNRLFHNEGPGPDGRVRFRDVTAESGLAEDCCTTVASWADVDLDGDLDLYVGRYLDPRKDIPTTFYARNGEPNRLYRNDDGGRFTDVTEEAGVGETGLCLGTVFGDVDDDGDPDLYVVNDFGRNTLYRNEGGGTFTDVTVASGTLAYGAGMNASMGDYDNDGRLDLYVTNIRSEHGWFAEAPTVMRYMANSWTQGVWRTDMPLYMEIFRQSGFQFVEVFQQMASGNNLLRNRGDGTFEDVSWSTGANPVGWFWGAVFADFDNDGWQDLYAANGWVYNEPDSEIELEFLNNVVGAQEEYKTGRFFDPEYFGSRSWHGWERNRHLRNEGDGTLREIGRPAGTDLLVNSRGVAAADFWNRGVVDLAIAASADRHALLRNEVPARRRWLQVELVGTRSNRDAVGARVTARTRRGEQTREVILGDGYASQSSLRLHFGLGAEERVEELVVRWPASGTVQSFRDVPANRIVEVTEGGELVEKRYPRPAEQ